MMKQFLNIFAVAVITILTISSCRIYQGEKYCFECDGEHTQVHRIYCMDSTYVKTNQNDPSVCAGRGGVSQVCCRKHW